MVIEQLPRDAAVLATVVLVLMIQGKGVTCDNPRHSRETSWDDNILELETSREPFKNDEAFVGDTLLQELRGSEHSENADTAVGNQEIQQDLKELEPDLEDQLFSEGEGGARAQRTELETQDDQQVQLDELKDKDSGVDGSQHTRRESKERLELQQQQQKEQKQQLDTLLGAEEGEHAQQHQKPHQKSKHEENGAIKLRQARADPNDKQQLHQEKLTSAGKNTVVVRSVQPQAKEDQQLKQEQLTIGVKGGTGVPHGRLQTRDNHESQQELLSKEGNSEVRAQHAPAEMEDLNWKLPHLSVSNGERGGGGARSAELETKQKWGIQGQQLSNEVGAGKTNDHMKFGMEENHQQIQLKNEKRAEVVNYPSKMDAADVLQGPQNKFDAGHAGAMSTQQGQMEAPDVRHLQQEEGKGAVGGQLDEEQQQLRQLAALGRIVESVRRNQEAGQQLKPNELLGHWMKPATARKEAALHNGPSSVEKLHPNENTLMGNSGHGQPIASERLVASKESEVPAVVKDDIQMSPSDTAEKDLMHNVGVGDDKPRTRESIGTIGSVGWRQPSKVAETEARASGTRHGAEQWLQTADSKSVVQELHAAGHRERPAGIEKRQRPQGELQGGAERQHSRKPADGSHRAHVEVRKVKKRARNKAASKDQQRARRRGKGANRAQRQHQHRALSRTQRQEFPNEQ